MEADERNTHCTFLSIGQSMGPRTDFFLCTERTATVKTKQNKTNTHKTGNEKDQTFALLYCIGTQVTNSEICKCTATKEREENGTFLES